MITELFINLTRKDNNDDIWIRTRDIISVEGNETEGYSVTTTQGKSYLVNESYDDIVNGVQDYKHNLLK